MTEESIKQLKTIKWLLVGILFCFLVIAGSVTAFSIMTMSVYEEMTDVSYDENCESQEGYIDRVDELLEDKNLEEALSLSESYIDKNPEDHNGYWYSGIAYYLKGDWENVISRMNKVEELVPSWKNRWIDPYRNAAQLKLIERNNNSDS